MTKCKVCNTDSKGDWQYSYHQFPQSPSRRRQWLKILNITTTVRKTSAICGRHFSSDQFIRTRLKKDALPESNPFISPPETDEHILPESSEMILPDRTDCESSSTESIQLIKTEREDPGSSDYNEPFLLERVPVVKCESDEMILPDTIEVNSPQTKRDELILPDSNELTIPQANQLIKPDNKQLILPKTNQPILAATNKQISPGIKLMIPRLSAPKGHLKLLQSHEEKIKKLTRKLKTCQTKLKRRNQQIKKLQNQQEDHLNILEEACHLSPSVLTTIKSQIPRHTSWNSMIKKKHMLKLPNY